MNFNKDQLQSRVNEIASEFGQITLGDMLAGGVVSDIYSALLTNNEGQEESIVVKYTKENIDRNGNFSKTDIENSFSKATLTHNFDVELQEKLNNTPQIIKHYPQDKITLMKNFNNNGFTLL